MWTAPFGVSLQIAEIDKLCHLKSTKSFAKLTMFLAVRYIVGPITRMESIIVQLNILNEIVVHTDLNWRKTYETERTLLDGRSSVPTVPVPCAGSCVREDSVLPGTVFGSMGLFY